MGRPDDLPITPLPGVLNALTPNFAMYGLGWDLRDYRGHKIVSHSGGLAGMTSHTELVPGEKLGVVVLTNMESGLANALLPAGRQCLPGGPAHRLGRRERCLRTPSGFAGPRGGARAECRPRGRLEAIAAAREVRRALHRRNVR